MTYKGEEKYSGIIKEVRPYSALELGIRNYDGRIFIGKISEDCLYDLAINNRICFRFGSF